MSDLTKRALEQSLKNLLLQKPLSKITISDIADDCGINRNTFYYHFADVPSLATEIITERADEVLDTVTAYDFAVLERREASGWCAVKLQKLAGAGTCCDTLRK